MPADRVVMAVEEWQKIAELEARAELALNLLAVALRGVLGARDASGDWMSVMDAYDILEGRKPGKAEPLRESVLERTSAMVVDGVER